jgi:ESCRT-II complex subunit VPS36
MISAATGLAGAGARDGGSPSWVPTQWTPFECLPVAAQTESGLLSKEEEYEVEVTQRQGVELRSGTAWAEGNGDDGGPALPLLPPIAPDGHALTRNEIPPRLKFVDRCTNLTVQLTTHRIVLWREAAPSEGAGTPTASSSREARYMHLSHVLQCSAESLFLKSPRILINTYMGDFLLIFRGSGSGSARDDLLASVHKALQRKEWERSSNVQLQKQRNAALTAHRVGVDAIMAKNQLRHKQAAQLARTAFADGGDAETLLREATELVAVIRKYVATLDRQHEQGGGGGGGGGEGSEADQLVSMLQDMGMTSALSKDDFRGRLDSYYEELARQLADFIKPRLRRVGGIMTLTDAYCLFNRARASNLISPDDMRTAVDYCTDRMKLGIARHIFPSGLVVLQDDSVSDRQVATRLREWAAEASRSSTGLNELEASKLLRTSPLLASEQLLTAERMGLLARDETVEMIRFFPNRFDEWVTSA